VKRTNHRILIGGLTRGLLSVVAATALAGPAAAVCINPNDPFQILDFYIDINPTDWNTILHDTTFSRKREAWLRCGDELPLHVAVRRKPTFALPDETNPVKVSLKIDVDEFVLDQEWNSHRKISLENGAGGQGELLREGIAWLLMARAGMITSGAAWVRLHVNDEPVGIYTRVEQIDKAFLRRHLSASPTEPGDEGFLYDEEGQRTREGEVDPYAAALCYEPFDTACPLPAGGYASVHEDLDVVQLLTLGAVNAFLLNPEGLLARLDNQWWYNSPLPRRYFAWDLDRVMNPLSDRAADPHTYERHATSWQPSLLGENTCSLTRSRSCAGDGDCPAGETCQIRLRGLFDTILVRLLGDPFHRDALDRLLDGLAPAIGPAMDGDPLNNFGGSFASELESIRLWLRERVALLQPQLPPANPFPVVINEVMASNMSTIVDEAGEFADWVELHNRSAGPVSLAGLYLSDSPAFPRRFRFPTGTSMPPGGYLIVWCDNDVLQGPLHTGFRLEKGGEMVGLFASDAERNRPLDFVWFDPQTTDVSIGRSPDGSPGIQTLREPSPGARNPGAGPGAVPPTVAVASGPGSSLTLSWEPSCSGAAQDYAIYEGRIGDWSSHTAIDCSDDLNDRTESITPAPGNTYYLIVPRAATEEGSYGTDSSGAERPRGSSTCAPIQVVGTCAP
jgi:hypothetical protein